ncbi:MAG: ABC transporter ATP-binding protein/permease [Candidatus Gracilibacteria bacterium]
MQDFVRLFSWMNLAKKDIVFFALRETFISITMVSVSIVLTYVTLALQQSNTHLLIYTLVAYSVFMLISIVIRIMSHRYMFQTVKHRLDTLVRDDTTLRQVLGSHPHDVEFYGTGRLMSIYHRDANLWITTSLRAIIQGIQFMVTMGIGMYFCIKIGSFWLLIAIMSILLSTLLLSILTHTSGKKWTSKIHALFKEWDRNATKIFMSYSAILQSNTQDEALISQRNIAQKHTELFEPYSFLMVSRNSFLTVILVAFYSLVAYILGTASIKDPSLLPYTLGILGFLAGFHGRMHDLMDFMNEFLSNFIQLQQGWKLIDGLAPFSQYEQGNEFRLGKGEISLKNVGFAYHENEEAAIKNMNIVFAGGKKTALIGPSGSGKSTIMKLIVGFLSPTNGMIAIDNQDLSSIALKTYFSHVGYLTQDPLVFDATIRENLLLGLSKDTYESDLLRALKLAQCDFILDFTDGIDTEIGEKGVRLSGGQKQRLAIAKIFLKNPEIILLDEPTSALDSFSEEQVSHALHKLFEGRTVIIIAHRLQTVKEADEIIYIENGEIQERGNHETLLQKKSRYARMLELQSGF